MNYKISKNRYNDKDGVVYEKYFIKRKSIFGFWYYVQEHYFLYMLMPMVFYICNLILGMFYCIMMKIPETSDNLNNILVLCFPFIIIEIIILYFTNIDRQEFVESSDALYYIKKLEQKKENKKNIVRFNNIEDIDIEILIKKV